MRLRRDEVAETGIANRASGSDNSVATKYKEDVDEDVSDDEGQTLQRELGA